jgi:hypothetical protein
MVLAILDVLLTAVHLGVVVAVLVLWIPRSTRRVHFALVMITAGSWLGIGLLYGNIGYCFLTDWHWDVKRLRGQTHLPASFIHYMVARWLKLPVRATTTDLWTGLSFAFVAILSIILEVRELWRRRTRSRARPL